MSIIRVHKTANFTVMSNYHFKEKKMSLKAKGLLSLMLSLPDDWNYSVSGLVSLSKDGKDSVMSALSELETFGYLTRVRTTDKKGKFSGIEYNIFEQPQLDLSIADNPISDNENAEKRNAGKPPLLNTKLTKDLFNKELNELKTKGEDIDIFEDILSSVVNVELRNLYVDYIEMRRNIEAPITKRGLKMLIQRNERLSGFNLRVQKLLLETAIINNWKNIYKPNFEEINEVNKEVLDELKNFYGDDE